MSDGIKRLRLGDGTIANVPDDQLEGFLKELNSEGVPFDVTEEPKSGGGGAGVYSEPVQFEPPAEKRWIDTPQAKEAAETLTRQWSDPWFPAKALGATAANLLGAGIGLGGTGAGVFANAARQGAGAAISGGADALANDPTNNVYEALLAAGKSGAVGAGVGGALSAAGKVPGLIADGASWLGDRARTAAYGASKYLDELGMTPREFSAETDRLGLNNKVVPQTPGMKLDRVLPAKEAAGQQIGDATRAADQAGIESGTKWGPKIAEDLYGKADATMAGPLEDDPRRAQTLARLAYQAEQQPQDTLTGLRQLKTTWEDKAYKGMPGSPESISGEAHQAAADQARDYLRAGMGQAAPEVQQSFNQGNQDYGSLATLEELLRGQRRADEPGAASLARGAAGALTGSPWTVAQSVGRSAGGLTADAIANGAYGVSSVAGGARDAALSGAQGAGILGAQFNQSDAKSQREQATQQSNGYRLPDVIEKLAYSNPQALGTYAQQFKDALDQPGGSGVEALLTKLTQTDPQFRMQLLPQLQQLTAGAP